MPLEYHQTEQVAVAFFPLGAQVYWEPEARLPLFESESVLLKPAHVALLGHVEMTPSFPRVGAMLRVAPVAIFDVTAKVYTTLFYGAFSSIYALPDGDVAATAAYKHGRALAGDREAGWGFRYDLSARLKGKAGPVLALVELELRHHDVHTWGGGLEYTWEPTEMLTVAAQGWTIHRNAMAFVQLVAPTDENDHTLMVGAMGNWNNAPATGDTNIVLGPVVAWKPAHGPKVPLLYLGAQAWIESRFVPTLPPYTFLAANWTR